MSNEVQRIQDLETPAVLLDVNRLESNIGRFQDIADREGVALMPHVKSTKTPQIWEMQASHGAKGFVAATLKEAETVMDTHSGEAPFNNVLIAYPHVNPRALQKIERLIQRHGAQVGLLVANDFGGEIVYRHFKGSESGMPEIYLAVDTGLHREGISPRGDESMQTIMHLADIFKEKLVGISTHAGHVYKKNSPVKVRRIARGERDQMIRFAERCRLEAGVTLREIGLGSTPTVNFFRNNQEGGSSITQVHPGNYAFMDNLQVGLGVAKPNECALTVLATVVDKRVFREKVPGKKGYRERGLIITDAGSKTTSSDSKPHGLTGASIYGAVYEDIRGEDLLDGVNVTALSEEHGKMMVPRSMLDQPIAVVGGKIRVLVQHACPVTNLAGDCGGIYVVDGERVIDNWKVTAAGH
ncbi:MAG: alanine racemase [Candidatus Gracilibacteria bacterium]